MKTLGGKRGKQQEVPSAMDSVEKRMAIESMGRKAGTSPYHLGRH